MGDEDYSESLQHLMQVYSLVTENSPTSLHFDKGALDDLLRMSSDFQKRQAVPTGRRAAIAAQKARKHTEEAKSS